jgi:uncharacterized protein YcbK (DUF882 family)
MKKGFSTRCMRPEDWKNIVHFRPSEFAHPDRMGYEFMIWLDGLRATSGVPMTITSSSRTPEHNRAVGGASNSAHTDVPCNAIDIGERPSANDPNWNYTRWRIVEAAIKLGCKRIGTYSNGSLHIDRTEDRRPAERMWRVVGAVVRS